MELVSIQSRVPIKSIAAKINVLVYQRNLSSNRFFLHFLPFVISQPSINQTLSRQVLQFTWNTCDSVIKIEEDGGRRDFWKLFHHSYIHHSRLIAANNSYILPCRVRDHSSVHQFLCLPHPSKGERRREKEASKDWRVAAIDHDALRWSGTADCASRGGTKRRGRRRGAASLPAAPNWLCQTAWPAGRTMRSPNLPSSPPRGQKELAEMPRPSKSQFFVPCHFRLPEDRVVRQAVALLPIFSPLQLHPFRGLLAPSRIRAFEHLKLNEMERDGVDEWRNRGAVFNNLLLHHSIRTCRVAKYQKARCS